LTGVETTAWPQKLFDLNLYLFTSISQKQEWVSFDRTQRMNDWHFDVGLIVSICMPPFILHSPGAPGIGAPEIEGLHSMLQENFCPHCNTTPIPPTLSFAG
jgi:hypothetical protein